MFSATTLAGCHSNHYGGVNFWTAGQRTDPNSKSNFIWRVTTDDGNVETPVTYTNWESTVFRQPDFWRQGEACMHILGNHDYKWNDITCHYATCSLCEIDMKYVGRGEWCRYLRWVSNVRCFEVILTPWSLFRTSPATLARSAEGCHCMRAFRWITRTCRRYRIVVYVSK